MLVYRLEVLKYETWIGPYKAHAVRFVRDRTDIDWAEHPGPLDDPDLCDAFQGRPVFMSGFLFGFKSIRDLVRWFYNVNARRILKENFTVSIAIYEIPATYVVFGETQLAFERSWAKLEKRVTL